MNRSNHLTRGDFVPFERDADRNFIINRLKSVSGCQPIGYGGQADKHWIEALNQGIGLWTNKALAWCPLVEASGSTFQRTVNEEFVERTPPLWIGSPDPTFPPRARSGEISRETTGQLLMWTLPDATVVRVGSLGTMVLDRRWRPIHDASTPLARLVHYLGVDFSAPDKIEKIRLDKPALLNADFIYPLNFCHSMLDGVPRILFSGIQGEYYVIVNASKDSWQIEMLLAFGVLRKNIIELQPYQGISAPSIVVPSNVSTTLEHPSLRGHPDVVQKVRHGIRKAIGGSRPIGARRKLLLLQRGLDSGRSLVNSDVVETEARRAGFDFVSVRAEDLSLTDQWRHFNEAECVLGVHGAGLTNLLAMPEGRSLVEILPSYRIPTFWITSSTAGVRYCAITDREMIDTDRIPAKQNVKISAATIRTAFEQLGYL